MSDEFNLEDWDSTTGAEMPHTFRASMLSVGSYDNIGDTCTKDTIEDYIKNIDPNREVFMTVLHNSATPAKSDNGLATVKSFYDYHVNNNGWKTIGYHFIISTDGTIYAGRKLQYTGAHAGPDGNPGSIGVCLVGDFETTDKPTDAQKQAFAALQTSLSKHYYGGEALKPRFHREFMDTECPGKITQDEVMGWITGYSSNKGTSDKPRVVVDKVDVGTGVVLDDSTYVKLRDFEKAGYRVGWDETNFIASISSPAK